MVEAWFGLLCVALVVFVVLDGWNIGAGLLHWVAGRSSAERREIVAALGPFWSWHEVWLLAFGATFLLAFPRVMATAFAGFYLALWLVLWSFILRGVSLEVGGHINDKLWRSWWDFVFAVSNVLLAVLFGAALGNVIRGVPLDGSGKVSMSLFTHFGVRGRVGILDWYTVSVAVVTTVLLAAHGATYLRLKTIGPLRQRSERLARQLWTTAGVLLAVVSLETWVVRPALYEAMVQRPLSWLAIAVVAGLLAGAAVSVFPVMLHSTLASEHSMTAYNGAAPAHGLAIALIWWPVAFVLAFTYFIVIMREYRGKVRPTEDTQGYS